jgi:hypothetical protein
MDGACSAQGEIRNVYKILVGKPEVNRQLSRSRRRQKGKVIPLHAMEAHGGREGIAPTHS